MTDRNPIQHIVERRDSQGDVRIAVRVRGTGPLVVLLPSLGRGGSDFDDLAGRLADAGWMAAAIDPRGVGDSIGPMTGAILWDYADDVAAVVTALGGAPAVLVGHAFGNRVVRATATRHPDAVAALILLAAGGQVAPAPEHSKALADVFDVSISAEAHREAVRTAFFAPGHDPEVWLDGWYPDVRRAQGAAGQATPPGEWIAAGRAPMLIVQGADDVIAPPGNAAAMASAYPDRVETVLLPQAGHAMLPEQPEAIARIVIDYLRRL